MLFLLLREEEGPLCDPGSELLLGRRARVQSGVRIINGMEKKANSSRPDCFVRGILQSSVLVVNFSLRSPQRVNDSTTGNPYWGKILIGISVGRGLGALKGLRHTRVHTRGPYTRRKYPARYPLAILMGCVAAVVEGTPLVVALSEGRGLETRTSPTLRQHCFWLGKKNGKKLTSGCQLQEKREKTSHQSHSSRWKTSIESNRTPNTERRTPVLYV